MHCLVVLVPFLLADRADQSLVLALALQTDQHQFLALVQSFAPAVEVGHLRLLYEVRIGQQFLFYFLRSVAAALLCLHSDSLFFAVIIFYYYNALDIIILK